MIRNVRGLASSLIIRAIPGGKDTGRRLTRGQLADSYGISHDGKWQYVETLDGQGWVSAQYLEPVQAEALRIVDMTGWPPVPKTREDVVRIFGPAGGIACSSGRAQLPKPLPLSWAREKKVTVIACHSRMVRPFEAVFAAIDAQGLWGLLEDFGGVFSDRTIAGSSRPSLHSWGIAVDLNTRTNPLGAVPTMDPRIVAVFDAHSFSWGGKWRRFDGMHFEWSEKGL